MSASDDTLLDATLTLQKLQVSAAADAVMWSPTADAAPHGASPPAAAASGGPGLSPKEEHPAAAGAPTRSPSRRRKVARTTRAPLRAHSASSSDDDGESWMLAPTRPSVSPPRSSDRENAPPPRAPTRWPTWSYNWDLPTLAGRQPSGRMRVLLLVRHGQYDSAPACDERRVLTPLGRSQAAATGRRLRVRLAALGCDAPATIVHSTMTRAVETALLIQQAAFPEASLQAEPALREGAPCAPDPNWWGPSAEDLRRDGPRIEAAFRKYFHRDVASAADAAPPVPQPSASSDATAASSDEEADITSSPVSLTPAPAEASAPAQQPEAGGSAPAALPDAVGLRGRCEIIVAHGNVIRFCVLRALQLPPEAWLRLIVPHASITSITITADGDALLTGLGDAGHLPPADVTT